ncbi:MAG: hypothetical protein KDC53_06060 [Saprospiraceae bacterium]|nr:hypothetical protein [Saprospiraceae bacterium]
MSLKIAFALLIGMTWGTVLEAQNEVIMSPTIQKMLNTFATKNKSQATIKAWRIQVTAVSDRRDMENEKTRFENIFPNLRLEWTFDNPYYILKLRDAAFKEKLEAYNLLHRVKRRYPSALLVLDDVEPEKVLYNPSF